ncbi:MFS transporter [Tsukamurella sp. 8F]|uniref:MFS transporter n=1 Tax=unclassified Tsukamurella TaxID=2633480 RepID=UPI0023B9493C|nr:MULTISPECIES: MFS transporter [unclassified Tsukamurella]MDF0528449.1 MFS transporter [Tsukamurella sp. 8J]MDF0586274.1 MFS transporter [Tsukamurella sp. 8F]
MSVTARTGRSPWTALAVLAGAMLTIGLDTMVLMVALPSLSRELGASTSQLQWITTSYPLVLGALMIPLGALGDRVGRVRMLGLSLLGFGAASAVCAFAATPAMLIVGRVLLGACAAAAMPLSMGVLPGLFPDPRERERAMGIWMASSAAGMPLGPILGGVLLQHFWWGSVFLINVPIAAVAAVAVWLLIPESENRAQPGGFDIAGVVLSVVGFGALVWAFTQAGQTGWASGRFLLLLAVAVVGLCAFAWRELTAERPLVRLTLLRQRGFLAGTVLAGSTMLLLASATFQLTQVFSVVYNADALGIGLRILPVVGALILGTRVGPRLSAAVGRRAVAVGSVLLIAAAFLLQATWSDGPYSVYLAVTILLGLGLGGVIPMAMALATGDLDGWDAGAGSALIQAIRQIASALGVAVFGSAVAAAYTGRLAWVPLPPGVEPVVRDNVIAGVTALRSADPGAVGGVIAAYQHGLAVAGWIGVGLALASVLMCALVPAESGRGGTNDEAGERNEAARSA